MRELLCYPFPPPSLPLELLPSSLLLAPSVARQLIAMNLNCCIHSPALAAVKKQQQKPETNGVLIFSRSCQSSPFPPFSPSLPPPLRHASAVKSAGVQGRLHSFLGQEAPRHLHKIWSLQTERTPCVCACVPRPPLHMCEWQLLAVFADCLSKNETKVKWLCQVLVPKICECVCVLQL